MAQKRSSTETHISQPISSDTVSNGDDPAAQAEHGKKTVLIVGCGIAGPVLAMFLQRAGFTLN